MTINATLQRLILSSPQPESIAGFHCHAFGYRATRVGDDFRCDGPHRSLWIRRGPPNQLLESHFLFSDPACFAGYVANLQDRRVPHTIDADARAEVLRVRDPDGRSVVFSTTSNIHPSETDLVDDTSPPARLQHYALRTPDPQQLLDFYSQVLSFTVSDLVRESSGALTAAFLRTDGEHHTLAIFRAPERRFDHLSCETRDWVSLRDWADWLAARSVTLVWGIGRHGPGNDTFFMVVDPDGNLAEISSELEVCGEERAIGHWEHRMETLNQWGVAILRS